MLARLAWPTGGVTQAGCDGRSTQASERRVFSNHVTGITAPMWVPATPIVAYWHTPCYLSCPRVFALRMAPWPVVRSVVAAGASKLDLISFCWSDDLAVEER